MYIYKTHAPQQGGILNDNFPDFPEQSTTAQAEEGSTVSSFFTDEGLSEK